MHSYWQMAWENGTKVIVMLTQCVEGGRAKCLQYWPDAPAGSVEIYGDFEVKLVNEVNHESYVVPFPHRILWLGVMPPPTTTVEPVDHSTLSHRGHVFQVHFAHPETQTKALDG